MKRFSFRMTFVVILLHLFLVASSVISQEKRGEKIIHGVIEKDPQTGAYRVTPESKPLKKKSFPKSKFDTQRFEKELTIQKRIASQQVEMKKLFGAQQTAKKEKQQKKILQQPKLKKVKFLGKETEFYEGPHIAKKAHSTFPTINSISNVLVNGKQVDTIFTGDPFTLAFSLSPNMLSAVVRIYIDMNKNGIFDDADLAIVNNGLVIDDGEIDVNPASGEFKMNFPQKNIYSSFVSTLIIEVDDYQSVSSAMLTIKDNTSSKIIIGTITPALKSTVVGFYSYTQNNSWLRYVIPDSTGECIIHFDTTASKNVNVQVFAANESPDGYVPPDTSFTIKKDTTRFSLSYTLAKEFIEGYVKDQHGDPVKKAIVEASSNSYIKVVTDSAGYYKIGVVKGTWFVYFNPPSASKEYLINNSSSYRYVQVGTNQTVRQDFTFLKSNSTISGSVKFGAIGVGGIPIYGTTDTVHNIDFTSANGNYVLNVYKPAVGSNYYTVSTGSIDYGYYYDSSYHPNISPGAVNVNFVMKKTTGGMQGKVTDINTGAPIVNAEIDFLGNSSRYILTNDSGYYKASLPDGMYSLYVYATYYDYHQENNVTVSGSFISKNISLTRTGSFSGSITDELGNPIPNVNIYSRDSLGYNYNYGYSDYQGKYVVSGLMTSKYTAQATAQGFISQWYDKKSVMDGATSFTVSKGFDTPNINFVLSRGGSISGTVKDKIGNGVSGVSVYALDTSLNTISMSATDDSGHYVVTGLKTGKYYAAAASNSFLVQWFDGVTNYTTATKVSVIINQNTPDINFSLIRGGTISGIVKDKGGNPIPDAQVFTLDTNYYYAQYTYTNDSGKYVINRIPPGIQRYVSATANGYSQRWYDNVASLELATSIIVLDEQKKENINFILPLGGKISGSVKNKAGTSIQYASVNVSQANGYNSYYASTDELGNYIIVGILPGKYIVSAYQNNYVQQWYNHKSSMELADTIVVAEEQTVPNINFNLSSGGKITGIVKNISGQPIQYTNVYATQANGYNSYGVNSNELGNYTVSNIPPGKYFVSAYQYEYIQQWYNHKSSMELADTIVVSEDSTKSNINFDLKPVPPPSTDSIIIKLSLANIPDTLVFNKTGLPDYWTDYHWGVRMDVDNNPSTGPNGCEIELVAIHYKNPGEPEYKSNIVDGTYHMLLEWIDNIGYQRHYDVVIALDPNDNKILTIKGPKQWIELNGVSSSTKYYIHTFSQLGDKSGTDNTDLSSGFIQVTDPSGDVWSTYYNYLDILKATPNIVTAVEDIVQSAIPTSYSLAQNYPNPFNPSTTIAFDLPKQEHVALRVYNIIGQEVATLVNEVRPAGRYNEKWAGTSLASGVYFYTLHSQSFSQTKKMIMLK